MVWEFSRRRDDVWSRSKSTLVKAIRADEQNRIEMRNDPIFIQYEGKNILIDTGHGKGKLSEKMMQNLGIVEEAKVEGNLAELEFDHRKTLILFL